MFEAKFQPFALPPQWKSDFLFMTETYNFTDIHTYIKVKKYNTMQYNSIHTYMSMSVKDPASQRQNINEGHDMTAASIAFNNSNPIRCEKTNTQGRPTWNPSCDGVGTVQRPSSLFSLSNTNLQSCKREINDGVLLRLELQPVGSDLSCGGVLISSSCCRDDLLKQRVVDFLGQHIKKKKKKHRSHSKYLKLCKTHTRTHTKKQGAVLRLHHTLVCAQSRLNASTCIGCSSKVRRLLSTAFS